MTTAASKKTSRAPARKAAPARKTPAVAKRPAAARKAPAAKAKPAPIAASAAKAAPKAKHKLVRDSFTMPQEDFDLIAALKKRAIDLGRPAKKSELLRAGLHALTGFNDTALKTVLQGLVELKAGRPRKER